MLLRIPKRPPGSRRQRELKRTEGDKLQAGHGRAAQSTEPQLRPRSTEEPWPPRPACVKEGRGGAFQAQTASLPEAPRSRPNQRRPPGHAAETLGTGAEGTAPAAEAGQGPTRCCPTRWHPLRGPPVMSAKAPLPLGASSPAGDSRQTGEARATEEGRVARERPGSHRSHRSRYFYDTKKKITSISFLFPTSVL